MSFVHSSQRWQQYWHQI
uniref:Uncharacterized protein n=1 Tax=Rhizophora mucronata TaxID=61149 RepID=A0A2P2JQQ9_RHIMU